LAAAVDGQVLEHARQEKVELMNRTSQAWHNSYLIFLSVRCSLCVRDAAARKMARLSSESDVTYI
jgi:hypothetical protein